ncbi:MAG TPA: hypothetical protein VH500_07460, partial [Nitrososphaeraceae archaeon]
MSQRQYQQSKGEAYSNFIDSINSGVTKREYNLKFSYFMRYCQRSSHNDMLLFPDYELESMIRDYIVRLR